MLGTPLDRIAEALAGFKWEYEKVPWSSGSSGQCRHAESRAQRSPSDWTGALPACLCTQGDVHHWIPLLDHFDAFFEQYVAPRPDLKLVYDGEEPPPFPTDDVLAVLGVTTAVLEHCSNKHLYNSYEARYSADDSATAPAALPPLQQQQLRHRGACPSQLAADAWRPPPPVRCST